MLCTRMPPCRRHPVALAGLALFAGLAQAQSQQTNDASLPRVEVVGATPLPGVGVPRDQIPSNVQTLGDRRLRQAQSLNLPDALTTLMPSANVNEVQGNPYQMDVNYRGFTASPLLGTPQGLSVFQDGVRINEPFGDVVNWDLVPRAALASLTLMPGSNPMFGLNTLGGALTLQTKSGDSHPGTEVELQAGSFRRFSGEVTHGRRLGESGHLFLAAGSLDEDGWRDYSPSRIRQLFAKTGAHGSVVSWDLSLTHATNRLIGNGPLPESMLAQRRERVYTRPDITDNVMTMLALNASTDLSSTHQLSALAYVRRSRVDTLNGDLNDEYDPPVVDDPAVENRTHSRQRAAGVALQSTQRLGAQQLTLGVSHDRSTSRFEQTQAAGALDPTLLVVPGEEPQTDALVSGRSRTTSVYAHDLVSLRPDLQLTLAGRYNDTRVDTVDDGRILLGLPTTLDGEGRYRKFNPAAGLTWQATPSLTVFGSLSQGNRAPSPIELGCSDPANACVLPNALQSDPPLEQVVSRTLEIGARGTLAPRLQWNAALFHSVNSDDLLFISNGLAAGYFTNFGRTQRQGVELGLSQQAAGFGWSASYSWLRATYRSSACIVAEHNSTAESSAACTGDDEIEIRPGDRIPGLPQHSLKLAGDWQPASGWNIGAQLRAYSGQFVRGNENNRHQPDGVEFNGSGRVGGFAVVDLTASWRLGANVEVFGKVANLFDRRYATSGLLGENAFDASGALLAPDDRPAEQFVGPGAPRAAWVGLRMSF
ncbi:TonB-dependent receptor [uncultured Piscinibacter sp.]|uniref:TonB-dependent receptor n=1 Tax=uncultured Piscinibacter sp. TaxID=1131835 RepID=UPI0026016F70|nr:TonB-dependent receptor [uncultured Piscinibacter sp.]